MSINWTPFKTDFLKSFLTCPFPFHLSYLSFCVLRPFLMYTCLLAPELEFSSLILPVSCWWLVNSLREEPKPYFSLYCLLQPHLPLVNYKLSVNLCWENDSSQCRKEFQTGWLFIWGMENFRCYKVVIAVFNCNCWGCAGTLRLLLYLFRHIKRGRMYVYVWGRGGCIIYVAAFWQSATFAKSLYQPSDLNQCGRNFSELHLQISLSCWASPLLCYIWKCCIL